MPDVLLVEMPAQQPDAHGARNGRDRSANDGMGDHAAADTARHRPDGAVAAATAMDRVPAVHPRAP
ncbi:MAG: hypothetical protein JF593_10355 [Novosphingobium sp.]|nr:hypothetical protein [Novosphingobium sp.]